MAWIVWPLAPPFSHIMSTGANGHWGQGEQPTGYRMAMEVSVIDSGHRQHRFNATTTVSHGAPCA